MISLDSALDHRLGGGLVVVTTHYCVILIRSNVTNASVESSCLIAVDDLDHLN
jgi:hypothetical protein